MNTNFKVISLTRLGTKPKSTDSEADALTTRPSELFVARHVPATNILVDCQQRGLAVPRAGDSPT